MSTWSWVFRGNSERLVKGKAGEREEIRTLACFDFIQAEIS